MPAALLFFRYFSARAPSIFSQLGKSMPTSSSPQIDWTCWLLGAFVQVFFKMFFPSCQHLVFVG
jgi:hypothetical protein